MLDIVAHDEVGVFVNILLPHQPLRLLLVREHSERPAVEQELPEVWDHLLGEIVGVVERFKDVDSTFLYGLVI